LGINQITVYSISVVTTLAEVVMQVGQEIAPVAAFKLIGKVAVLAIVPLVLGAA